MPYTFASVIAEYKKRQDEIAKIVAENERLKEENERLKLENSMLRIVYHPTIW